MHKDRPPLQMGPPTVVKVRRGKKKTVYTEIPALVNHEQARALRALYDKEPPKLEHVVVRCNRETGKWHLFRNNEAYKELDALILINVSFSCQWKEGEDHFGCGNRVGGEYMGFAAGDVLPVATPLSVPTKGVIKLRFNPDNGEFYNSDTGDGLDGAGYLILKKGCSSEYVDAQVIGS